MSAWADVVELVRQRAGNRCEYCRMHQDLQGATFHVEHIIPSSAGGPTESANLAWACPGCNLQKSDRTQAIDPVSREVVALFNPRTQAWPDHFGWQRYRLEGLTPCGRATILALNANSARRQLIRQAEELFALFPPN